MASLLFTFLFMIVHIFVSSAQVLQPIESQNRNQKTQMPELSTEEIWTVYDRSNFGESELCRVLNCRKRDYCLVKGEDAICLGRKKLREAPGRKVFYRRSDGAEPEDFSDGTRRRHPVRQSVTKQRHRSQPPQPSENDISTAAPSTKSANGNAMEWDPDRVRQKLAAYYQSLKRKERNRAALARANTYEVPNTFKENAANGNAVSRSNGDQSKRKRCNQDQLLDISVRLPQWFRDMQAHHEPLPSTSWRRRNLPVACRTEALWMFSQLDHDGDLTLDSDELYALTYDQYEPCVKPFLDRCDRNIDNRLSLQEWCLCFP